jgi:hypothetical protein
LVQESKAMLRWFCVALRLLAEAGAARRDVRIRFLKAQVEILRRKLGGNRVIAALDEGYNRDGSGFELDPSGRSTLPLPMLPDSNCCCSRRLGAPLVR